MVGRYVYLLIMVLVLKCQIFYSLKLYPYIIILFLFVCRDGLFLLLRIHVKYKVLFFYAFTDVYQ